MLLDPLPSAPGGGIIDAMSALAPIAALNSPWAWGILLLLALLFFGRRLPGAARSLGQGINEFKKGLSEGDGTKIEKVERIEGGAAKKTDIDQTSV